MAKQIEGVYESILECARKEFLEKGYMDASLRTIASEAGTSTNSIYVRFKDKEGLFAATVEPFLDASYGTKFHNFVDSLVSMEEEYTWKWMEATGSQLETEGEMTKEFYHIMTTSYFQGIFEVVRHKMGREDAKKYVAMMGKYHHAGFLAIVGEKTAEVR